MGQDVKRSYLEAIRRRYKKVSRSEKAKILDEFCAVCSYNRKYAIRLLSKRIKRLARKPGPRPYYPAEQLLEPLKAIWLAADHMCTPVRILTL